MTFTPLEMLPDAEFDIILLPCGVEGIWIPVYFEDIG
jgi:hypothetical protein